MGPDGPKWGQEDFFLLIQTLPTFWATRILILRIFIFWIFWVPNFWLGPSLGPAWARLGPSCPAWVWLGPGLGPLGWEITNAKIVDVLPIFLVLAAIHPWWADWDIVGWLLVDGLLVSINAQVRLKSLSKV